MKKSRLFLLIIFFVPFFTVYAQTEPIGLTIRQIFSFTPPAINSTPVSGSSGTAFLTVRNNSNSESYVMVNTETRSWGPYKDAGNLTWSPDNRQLAFWARDSDYLYYLYNNGEKTAGPFQNPPDIIDFVFGNNTLAYMIDGTLYMGDKSLIINNYYKGSLTVQFAHRRPHFAFYNHVSREFMSSDFHDAFDEMPVIKYVNTAEDFFAVGLRKDGRGNQYRDTYSLFYNNTRNTLEFDKDFYKAVFSPDGSKYALVFQERKSDGEYFYTLDDDSYNYIDSLTCYYFLPGMAAPKLMYIITNTSRSGHHPPEVLPCGLTSRNTFVYVTQKDDGFYIVENDNEFGPYTSITDNYAGTSDKIDWTALSGNRMFNVRSR
jgi:hypothetical protein